MNPIDTRPSEPDDKRRYSELRHKVLDRTADEAERAEFEAIVLSTPELKSDFAEYLHQESSLLIRRDSGEAGALVLDANQSENGGRFVREHRRFSPMFLAVAVALLVMVTLAGTYILVRQPRPVLVIASAKHCQWGLTTSATTPGTPLAPGRFVLNTGIAVMKLPCVDLTIEGPTDIEVLSEKRCLVRSGKVFANVHPGGEGFVVETPTSLLTDRGTIFAVHVSPWGDSDLTVVKGIVDAEHKATGESRSVGVQGGLLLTAKGVQAIDDATEIGPMDSGVPTEPIEDLSKREMQISTAVGNGRDAYVIAGQEKPHTRTEGMLLAKITPDRDSLMPWRRRIYLHFDLSLVSEFTLHDAVLQLRGLSTNIGYLSQTPDTWFAVYGLTAESEEDWSEDAITWGNSPGMLPDHTSPDPNKTVLLGKFMVLSSDVTNLFRIKGETLVRFLSRDSNRGVTLLVIAESMGDNECWAHGFASRRHPELQPPTLRLTLDPKAVQDK